jgi:hypothetical protein
MYSDLLVSATLTRITGMMHESGTGGAPKYGVIPQMPLTSIEAPVNLLDNQTYAQPRVSFFLVLSVLLSKHLGRFFFSNLDCVEQQQVGNDTASVGYFKTTLQNDVVVELSASRHAGIINYLFPGGGKYILIDVSHVRRAFSSDGRYTIPMFLTTPRS